MTTIFKFNAISGQFDLVTNSLTPSEIVGGTPDTFAGFDSTGAMQSIPGWSIDANSGGGNIFLSLSVSLPPGEGFNSFNIGGDIDATTEFLIAHATNYQFQSSAVVTNTATGFQENMHVFSGATLGGITSFNASPLIDSGAILTGGYQGVSVGPALNASFGLFGFGGYRLQGQLDNLAAYGQAFVDNFSFENDSEIVGDYQSFTAGPQFQVGSIVRSYSAVNVNPTFAESITDDVFGVNVGFTNTTAGQGINGLNVNFQNVTSTSANVIGLNINLTNTTDSNPQGVTGIQSNARIGLNATTDMISGAGFQIGNRIQHQYSVPAGSPITGTDSIGNNFAGDLVSQDDIGVGGFGIGWNSVGFVATTAIAATKTIDKASIFLPAMSLADPGFATGGTIDDLAFVRVYPPLAQGGTAVINNLYGFKIDSLFGDFAASSSNAYGLHLDTSAPNYMGTGTIQFGGSTSGILSLRAAATTTSHTLTMPAAQGAASTVLTNDGSGNLSWAVAGGGPTTFTIVNNQSSLANVTGFLVNSATNRAFVAETSTERYHTGVYVDEEDLDWYTNAGTGAQADVNCVIDLSDTGSLFGGNFLDFNGNGVPYLVKLNFDGTEDTAFTTNLGASFDSPVSALAEQADGKLLVGGSFTSFDGNGFQYLARLNDDGTDDTGFYSTWTVGFSGGDVRTIFVQADGKILVGGSFTSFNGNTRNRLVRLNDDGSEDATFYTNLGTGFDAVVYSVIELANTDIMVGGSFLNFNGNARQYLVKLVAAGTEDGTFNGNYDTTGGLNSTVSVIKEQADTKLLVGGDFTVLNTNTRNALVRLNADGTEDGAFYTALGTGFTGPSIVANLDLQGTNIIVVGGFTLVNGVANNRAARLLSTGAPDSSFTTAFGAGFDQYTGGVAVQSNQQILFGGQFQNFDGLSRERVIRFGTVEDYAYISQDTIKGVYSQVTSSWTIAVSSSLGSPSGVTFQMTNAGQLQYTSTNIGGTLVTSQMKFLIEEL